MSVPDAPVLAGVHHLKLPVTDLTRSREWYHSRLGYQVELEFVEQGQLMGLTCQIPHDLEAIEDSCVLLTVSMLR